MRCELTNLDMNAWSGVTGAYTFVLINILCLGRGCDWTGILFFITVGRIQEQAHSRKIGLAELFLCAYLY